MHHVPAHPSPPTGTLRKSVLATLLALAAAGTITACQPAVAPAAATVPAAPPPVVKVAAATERAVQPVFAQVGRVEAAHRVEIRPRVAGHIEAVLFREGDLVRAGQPLFRIDPRPFDAALERARAELQLARARESLARSEAERAARLVKDQAIAAEEAERRAAAHAEAQARSAAAEAAVRAAALDREFCIVAAPHAGRIGRAHVTAGNYVAAGGAQAPLATIAGTAPLHVYFDIGDADLIAQVLSQRQPGRWQARVLDAQGATELARAPVDFVDNEVAGQAGTLRLRARLDKPVATLGPGQFVRVQLAGIARASVLVPEQAIGTDQGQRFVLVVKDGQVEYRAVRTAAAHGSDRVVTHGVQPGEQVVVSGLMKVRPGMKVQPQPAGADAASAAAPATPASKV